MILHKVILLNLDSDEDIISHQAPYILVCSRYSKGEQNMSLKEFKLPHEDLASIASFVNLQRSEYENSEILIYGGTGFIGSWLTEGLVYSDRILGLNLRITLVTRNQTAAKLKFGNFGTNSVRYIEHDFAKLELKTSCHADYVFHGATPTRSLTGSDNEGDTLKSSVNAAKHATEVFSRKFILPRVVHLSSGVIYGNQPIDMRFRPETDSTGHGLGTYSEAKVAIDQILRSASETGKISFQSPRLFAFAGPLLQLDAHFAAGNFILDGLSNRPIQVKGNPETIRSYMYPSDLVVALLTIATQDEYQNFNVGSEESISMSQLATLISSMTSNSRIEFTNPNALLSNYVPSISNLKEIMPQFKPTGIHESISKWINWIHTTNQLTKGE